MKEKIQQFQDYFLSKKPRFLIDSKSNKSNDKRLGKRKSVYPMLSDLNAIFIKKVYQKKGRKPAESVSEKPTDFESLINKCIVTNFHYFL